MLTTTRSHRRQSVLTALVQARVADKPRPVHHALRTDLVASTGSATGDVLAERATAMAMSATAIYF